MEKEQKGENILDTVKSATGDMNLTTIDIDNSFGFKCQQCGKCCIGRNDIILNPFDVYNGAKYLGITPTEFIQKYATCTLGAHSKIPMLILKTAANGFCPLLKFDIKDGGKFKCEIHPAKPSVCANHPIGVMKVLNSDVSERQYVKVTQCPNSVSNEQHTVREWIRPYLEHQAEIDLSHKIQHLVTTHFNPRKLWFLMSFMLKNMKDSDYHKEFEPLILEFGDRYTQTSISIGYADYDISKPFIEQAESNIESLNDFYIKTNDLFEDLKSVFKEITGTDFEEIFESFEKFNDK